MVMWKVSEIHSAMTAWVFRLSKTAWEASQAMPKRTRFPPDCCVRSVRGNSVWAGGLTGYKS